jgi:hypothetical protein
LSGDDFFIGAVWSRCWRLSEAEVINNAEVNANATESLMNARGIDISIPPPKKHRGVIEALDCDNSPSHESS